MTETTNNEFSASDMATAAAQGFRDGVASVRPAAAVVQEVEDWSVFFGYLIDNYEGHEIAEERLQGWLSEMLRDPHYGALFRREKVNDGQPSAIALAIETAEEEYGSLRAAAKALGIDPGYLSRLASGEKDNPSDKVLSALGIERVTIYRAAAPAQPASPWISVEDRLPESGRTVLAFYLNSHGKGRRVRAEYIAAKTKSADDGWDSDSPADYDEQADEYFWPAGWYEVMDNWDELTHMVIHEGEVTHWMPLPSAPEQPAKEVL